jgi:sulfotransferase famil protein
MVNDVLIHAHVPKCGGSTLNLILRNNFRRRFRPIYDLAPRTKFSCDEVRELIDDAPSVWCFASHAFSFDLPFRGAARPCRGIALVRDPVRRFLSSYFYHRNHTRLVPQARQLKLEDYISYALRERNQPTYLDGQTLLLGGSADAEGVERIQRLLSRQEVFLFPLEQLDKACVLLEKIFPESFRDCSYVRVRVSRKDQEVTAKAIESIRSYGPVDERLWGIAQQHLDDLLLEHFGSPSTVEKQVRAFRLRCLRAGPRLVLGRAIHFLRRMVSRSSSFKLRKSTPYTKSVP